LRPELATVSYLVGACASRSASLTWTACLLNHPELARRIEELGFFLKFDGTLPRPAYQFIVLSVAQATGAAFEWHDHVQHALAAQSACHVPVCNEQAGVRAISGSVIGTADPVCLSRSAEAIISPEIEIRRGCIECSDRSRAYMR
jgi:hypothetical protein